MDLELKDKVAVITGGSVGIGLAVAVGLAAEGVHVVIIARQADRVHAEAKGIADKLRCPRDRYSSGCRESERSAYRRRRRTRVWRCRHSDQQCRHRQQ